MKWNGITRSLAMVTCMLTGTSAMAGDTIGDDVTLTPYTFAALRGWSDAQALYGLRAFRHSCIQPRQMPPVLYGRKVPLGTWNGLCAATRQAHNAAEARLFMERYFTPYRVTVGKQQTGLLTGYYTPTLNGSLHKSEAYPIPIYGRPEDDAVRTRYSRADIEAGALAGKGLEILWVDSAIDAFFLHVQGSGYVTLEDGTTHKLAFAGKNELPYTAIGRRFVEEKLVTPEKMSMQWLRAWLQAHPKQAAEVMQRNKSYIFFSLEKAKEQVKGAEGTALSPQHSVAIDPTYMTYGMVLYLETHFPNGKPFNTMVVAQDTGSAIKGPLRADLYTGAGENAAELAGLLKSQAHFYALLPAKP
jgi:membrane-bound lytic murein transglycosylase A